MGDVADGEECLANRSQKRNGDGWNLGRLCHCAVAQSRQACAIRLPGEKGLAGCPRQAPRCSDVARRLITNMGVTVTELPAQIAYLLLSLSDDRVLRRK